MTLSTPLTTLLGINHPVLLAPMAKVSGGASAGERTRYDAAAAAGDFDEAAVIAGEAADLIRDVAPAGAIVERVVAEAEALLRGAEEFIRR